MNPDPARVLLQRFDELYNPPNFSHHAAYVQTITEFPNHEVVVHERTALIGHVPEIQVGEMFRVRYEAMLAGLHNHPVKGICTGPAPALVVGLPPNSDVATCVVCRYPLHNFQLGGPLVMGGEGGEIGEIAAGNRLGQRVLGHQFWTPRNIAMHNSILADTPVRLLAFYETPNGMRYVYHVLFRVVHAEEVETPEGFDVLQFHIHPIAN